MLINKKDVTDDLLERLSRYPNPSEDAATKKYGANSLLDGERNQKRRSATYYSSAFKPFKSKPPSQEVIQENVLKVTGGLELSEREVMDLSPEKFGEITEAEQAAVFMYANYREEELLNVIWKVTLDNTGKARPRGGGVTANSAAWVANLLQYGLPEHYSGMWIRMNPVTKRGSGLGGAYKDRDVVSPRYVLLEADHIPLSQQLAVLLHLPLPIVSITASGSRSAHALVCIDASDVPDYKKRAKKLLSDLMKLGFDISNCNPSRMTRLPGAVRKVDGVNGGVQRLLFLNPNANSSPILPKND